MTRGASLANGKPAARTRVGPYAVQTLTGGLWQVVRFARLAAARRFARRETERLRIVLVVHRVDAVTLQCWEDTPSGWRQCP